MHDNGEILILLLKNEMSPQGLFKTCFNCLLAQQRQERVLEDEEGPEGKGRVVEGGVGH